jgi:hypothetical protein
LHVRGRAGGRAGGHVTDEQRNEAKAARGAFAAMERRTRGGRGRASALTPFGIVPGRAAAKNLCPLCLFLLSVFADTFIESNKHVKQFSKTQFHFVRALKGGRHSMFHSKWPLSFYIFLMGIILQVAIKKISREKF